MAVRTEPQVRKYGPLEAAESQARLQGTLPGTDRPSIPSEVDRPSVAPMVDGGSSIVPSQVDSGNLPPRVDRKG